ncbi:MAG: helix-turn-helix transcriptional regulator [Chloroflexota bacterium]
MAALRADSGASQAAVAVAAGIDRAHLSRIEAGTAQASVEVLVSVATALGADLGVRFFAGVGPRIRDRFQAPMIEALIRRLDGRWTATPEVPVVSPARGVVDLVLHERVAHVLVAVEAQSEIRRLEQQMRWLAEKQASLESSDVHRAVVGITGSPPDTSRMLLLRSTTSTRDIARRFAETLRAAFPASSADALAALSGSTRAWPGPTILWVRVERGEAVILDGPPRGVSVGR